MQFGGNIKTSYRARLSLRMVEAEYMSASFEVAVLCNDTYKIETNCTKACGHRIV
jgi:hypothetical protein